MKTVRDACTPQPNALSIKLSDQIEQLDELITAEGDGEALREATYGEWKRRVGSELYEHYGVSEYQLVIGHGVRHPVKPGSVGKSLPGVDVAILDVPAVFAQVNGDAVGAAERCENGRRDRVRFMRAPRLPHGRHVVDVHTQAYHRHVLAYGV